MQSGGQRSAAMMVPAKAGALLMIIIGVLTLVVVQRPHGSTTEQPAAHHRALLADGCDGTCVTAAEFAEHAAAVNASLAELRRGRQAADDELKGPAADVRELLRAVQAQVGELQHGGRALAQKLEASKEHADRLELQVAELRQEQQRDSGERRRAQRTGGAEAAQILKIETAAISCPLSSGRFGLAECQDPAFERCHQEACAPILQGHRRLQAGGQSCTAQALPARTAAVNPACCPGDECSKGHPDTCSAACAGVFLAWWDDCEVALGKDGRQFEPTVELCEAAEGTEVSIAMQLGVECTDGSATADCVPDCSEPLHGFLMLLNIGGDDLKLSCELRHGFYSWVGAATDGGYLGADFETFFSAIVSGAAGVYVGMLLQDAYITTDLTVRPGQQVYVNGDVSLAQAPLWGSGSFEVQARASLSLTYVALGGAVSVVGGTSSSASLSAMAVPIALLRQCQYQLSGAGSTLRLSGVTVLDSPTDWGELTATSIVEADGATVMYDPPAAFTDSQALPTFAVASGPCTITAGGACFRSPDYPNDYRIGDCAITVYKAGSVRATTFDTQSFGGRDYVTIDGVQYAGTGGAIATAGVAVSDGGTISWHTNGSRQRSGFEICGFDACGQHGSSGGGTTCVCIGGYTGALCEQPPAQPFSQGFDYESYTISGCADTAHCGTFRRVAARCTSGDACPGGGVEYSSSTDPSLCAGTPVYQKGDGPVLYRWELSDGRTYWRVSDNSALETCNSRNYLFSATTDQNHRGPPTAPAYSGANDLGGTGWVDFDASPHCSSGCGIAIAAGGH